MGVQKTSLSCGVRLNRDLCYFQYFAINNRNIFKQYYAPLQYANEFDDLQGGLEMNLMRNNYFIQRPIGHLKPNRLNIEDGHLKNLLPGLCQAQTQLFKT